MIPEPLLERGRDGRRERHELGPARRLAQQVVERVADEVGDRLVPGEDEAHHLVHQLGLAEGRVAAARDERAREVLARVHPLPGDVLAQEVLVLDDTLRDGNLPLRGHHRRQQREEVLPPALEVLDVAVIHIAEARDDPERQRTPARRSPPRVPGAPGHREVTGSCAELGLQRLHPRPREGAVDDAAPATVRRRISVDDKGHRGDTVLKTASASGHKRGDALDRVFQ